ncbi:hypothetical protein DSTSK_15880 [Desulforhabdus sp. TSK]|nr:hypothetical protein DSTSK_15880 [Desulforhabdus sp. TSK]
MLLLDGFRHSHSNTRERPEVLPLYGRLTQDGFQVFIGCADGHDVKIFH